MIEEKSKSERTTKKKMDGIMPYPCLHIDAHWKDYMFAAGQCLKYHSASETKEIEDSVKGLWSNVSNQNTVLPCLSVRSCLDLYLKVMAFPPGSEVIMSAINIPDMLRVVEHHKLKVVPWDISIETIQPKIDLLPSLITNKTVAIIVAHIYGKWCDMEPIIEAARSHDIKVIEDCAESFCGFDRLGHPATDLALFSFGIIKFYTSFGGAIAKVKDENVYSKMLEVYHSYTTQSHRTYLQKILKYFLIYFFLNVPSFHKATFFIGRSLNFDHKKLFVKMLRGFPDQMLQKIKSRPSPALLAAMKMRFEGFNQSDFEKARVKGDYVRMRLPDDWLVGMEATVNNYWLFPVLVENPDTVVKLLYAMGIDAYRGATQLNLIEPDQSMSLGAGLIDQLDPRYPPEAGYLIDQDVYIPVQKIVQSWFSCIYIENPDTVVKLLYAMGIDAYRGATQLNLIEPDQTTSLGPIGQLDPRYPSEARYLIDHAVYIPVQKNVPFHELNRLCTSVIMAVKSCKDGPKVRIQSKL